MGLRGAGEASRELAIPLSPLLQLPPNHSRGNANTSLLPTLAPPRLPPRSPPAALPPPPRPRRRARHALRLDGHVPLRPPPHGDRRPVLRAVCRLEAANPRAAAGGLCALPGVGARDGAGGPGERTGYGVSVACDFWEGAGAVSFWGWGWGGGWGVGLTGCSCPDEGECYCEVYGRC